MSSLVCIISQGYPVCCVQVSAGKKYIKAGQIRDEELGVFDD